jgi:hypothetical protein
VINHPGDPEWDRPPAKQKNHGLWDGCDLCFLLESGINEVQKKSIHQNLMTKALARGIEPRTDSLSDPELRRRAKKEYATLADEIQGDLPDFDASFALVESFYRSLPWP